MLPFQHSINIEIINEIYVGGTKSSYIWYILYLYLQHISVCISPISGVLWPQVASGYCTGRSRTEHFSNSSILKTSKEEGVFY